jgi:tetratricopeptide (TPR) repeat protein
MKQIFISYSHEDEKWKDKLVKHLKVLEPEGLYSLWDDRKIGVGSDWLPQIEKALDESDAAIMMVSADFLTSDFILNKEVPRLMERRQKEGLLVIPFILRPCQWQKVSWLSPIQAAPENGVPLTMGSEFDIEKKLNDFAGTLFNLIAGKVKPGTGQGKKGHTVLLTPLPPRKVKLIGRDRELKELKAKSDTSQQVLLLNGLGGIGKTEVCKRLFYEHYKEYSHAAWVDYVSSIRESFVNVFAGVSGGLVVPGPQDTEEVIFEKIMTALNKLDACSLLIVDNIEDMHDPDLDRVLALPFKVIANSRSSIQGFDIMTLGFLSPGSCRKLFYSHYKGKKDDKHVNAIVALCNCHTLTIELLARTAQNAAKPVKWLHDTLKEKSFNLNEVIKDRVHTFWHDETQKKLFFEHLLTIFDLAGLSEEEKQVLTQLSVLPPIFVAMDTVKDWLQLESNEAVNGLISKGWLRQEGFEVFMHQVIQEVIRYTTSPDAEKCKNLILSLTKKLYLEPGENPIAKKEYILFADSVLGFIEDHDQDLATLANNLSLIYQDLGQADRALEFQQKATKIYEAVLDPNHSSLATSYNNLSMIYQDLGQADRALEFQQKATKIYEAALDPIHPSLATSYNNLSMIYKALGQADRALEFQQKALQIREKVLDPNHPDLASSYNNLSLIYKALGQADRALEFQQKATKIYEAELDPYHPLLATSYHNLSIIYQDLGNNTNAIQYAEKAVSILEALFPGGHPNLEIMRKNLSFVKSDG